MGEHLVIYYNDSIDSDNWAAALALALSKCNAPNTRIIWILEPRQVSLGLSMTAEERSECQKLIAQYFPEKGPTFKVLLGGTLNYNEIDAIAGLSDNDKRLLHFAVKPADGPKEDAIIHRQLTAWDSANCLSLWSKSNSVEVHVDVASLDRIHNPVNLNFHHQDELIARNQIELEAFDTIMKEPLEQRREKLRHWYKECTYRIESAKSSQGTSVKALDFESLCADIEKAATVNFFGGSSLDILQRFIERGVASKIDVHLQVGSMDLSANLFSNQFNIALNPDAARFVFANFRQFEKFTVVPSHTAQSVKYSLAGLAKAGGGDLAKRCLGFNCREDPIKIAKKQVTLEKDHPGKACPMPDLTTFLCALSPGFSGARLSYVQVDERGEAILFREEADGIPMYDIKEGLTLGEEETIALLNSLAGNGDTTNSVSESEKGESLTQVNPIPINRNVG